MDTKKTTHNKIKNRRLTFYLIGIIWPVLQFLVFYLFVNFNSILLSMKKLDTLNQRWVFVGFENFKQVIMDFKEQPFMQKALINTFEIFGISIVSMLLPLTMSFYLYKKNFMSSIFKVFLFLPSIISSMALVLCFKYFVEFALPEITEIIFNYRVTGLLQQDKVWGTLIFYYVWFSMGGHFLLYLGAMSGISDAIIEAAQIDGVNNLQEFIYIVFPLIFPTFMTFLITSFATLFTNQLNIFTFKGANADYDIYTIGYYLYREAQSSGVKSVSAYPKLSALGVLLTICVIPLCFGTKYLLTKIGPKSE